MLPTVRQVPSRALARVTRRRLGTETTPPPPPKKKRRVLRNGILATAALTGGFYVGSIFVAFNNSRYYDFFSESVPLGEALIEYGENHRWDTLLATRLFNLSGNKQRVTTNNQNGASKPTEAQKVVESLTKEEASKDSKGRFRSASADLKTGVAKRSQAAAIARHRADQFSEGLDDLVRKAEAAISQKSIEIPPEPNDVPSQPTDSPPSTVNDLEVASPNLLVYDSPLPIGFEPPPGYTKLSAPKRNVKYPFVKPDATPFVLPPIAPAIAEHGISEPVIAELASTIDNLASFVNSNPEAAAKAKDVLDAAKVELTTLSTRIEKAREEERVQLEEKLDEQAKEYTIKLLELEMEYQDQLDGQKDGFQKFLDQEKVKFVQAYREKLESELATQTELINERLRAEVIAQGIEMQRRWIREIKIRVEQERGGRLSKLDELAANIKRLERITLDNSSYLDENIRVHSLWSVIRALNNVIEAPARRPFRDELRVLRHINAAKEEPLVAAALESLEKTDTPDIGIEPFADLASWFSTSVAPNLTRVALVPDQDAGVLSHLASYILSSFRFRRHGLVPGSDVLSVLARTEYYMNEKDLDSAARELNQLKGTAKVLLSDWLDAARRRLEVLQALEVIQAQATLASLSIL